MQFLNYLLFYHEGTDNSKHRNFLPAFIMNENDDEKRQGVLKDTYVLCTDK